MIRPANPSVPKNRRRPDQPPQAAPPVESADRPGRPTHRYGPTIVQTQARAYPVYERRSGAPSSNHDDGNSSVALVTWIQMTPERMAGARDANAISPSKSARATPSEAPDRADTYGRTIARSPELKQAHPGQERGCDSARWPSTELATGPGIWPRPAAGTPLSGETVAQGSSTMQVCVAASRQLCPLEAPASVRKAGGDTEARVRPNRPREPDTGRAVA